MPVKNRRRHHLKSRSYLKTQQKKQMRWLQLPKKMLGHSCLKHSAHTMAIHQVFANFVYSSKNMAISNSSSNYITKYCHPLIVIASISLILQICWTYPGRRTISSYLVQWTKLCDCGIYPDKSVFAVSSTLIL